MSFKTTYVLFAVLICLLAVFGLTQLFGKKPGLETYILPAMHNPEVKVDEITGVTITRSRPKEEKIVFVRDPEKNWRLTEPFPAHADRFAVEELVRQVMDAHREEKANLTSNLKQFGLEPPAAVITLEKGADQKWSMNVGNESTGGPSESVVYVTAGDQPKDPLAVRRTEISSVFKTTNEFRPKHLVAESSFDIQSVKLQEPKHELVAIDKSSEGKWRGCEISAATSAPGVP